MTLKKILITSRIVQRKLAMFCLDNQKAKCLLLLTESIFRKVSIKLSDASQRINFSSLSQWTNICTKKQGVSSNSIFSPNVSWFRTPLRAESGPGTAP